MATKSKSSCGHYVYRVSLPEVIAWGGLGICDLCNVDLPRGTGFLIPVINRCYCSECFAEWDTIASFCSEDVEYENEIMDYYEQILNIDKNKGV